jgi:hypothetical protein
VTEEDAGACCQSRACDRPRLLAGAGDLDFWLSWLGNLIVIVRESNSKSVKLRINEAARIQAEMK